MPTFALDRDLLTLEPNLFRDAGWATQRLAMGTASIAGTTLTMTSDTPLDAAGITAGHIIVVGGTAYEVLARTAADQLTVSRLRADRGDAALPPSPTGGTPVAAAIYTFLPQIAEAHRQLLAWARITQADASAVPDPGLDPAAEVPEAWVLPDPTLTRLESLLALAIIWSAAGAASGDDSPAAQRAGWYRRRADRERARVRLILDRNGDGAADLARTLHTAQLRRG